MFAVVRIVQKAMYRIAKVHQQVHFINIKQGSIGAGTNIQNGVSVSRQ